MKKVLQFLLTLIFISSLHSQTVIIKDSVIATVNDGISVVALYTYNTNCLVTNQKSPSYQVNYIYDSKNRLYQSTSQDFDKSSNTYINSSRNTYTYNDLRKVTEQILEYWNKDSSSFINYNKEEFTFDQNNLLVKSSLYYWDNASGTWKLTSESTNYNNSKGQIDSITSISYEGENAGELNYVGYYSYDSSERLHQVIFYSYILDTITQRNTYYYDSSDYIQRDSIVNESIQPGADTFSFSYYGVTVTKYIDERVSETDVFFQAIFAPERRYTKTFYFYGPCSSALPVTLLNFSGSRQNNNAILKWQTANETNASSFQIQRSTDGEHFTTVGSISASGNSSNNKNYTYTDVNAFLLPIPKLYYRLAETDKNGIVNYSKIITLDITASKLSVYVSPNPVTNSINVYAAADMTNARIIVSDMRGKIVYSGKQTIVASNKITIDASRFAKGMYIVTIQSASAKQQMKIVKE